MSLVRTPVMRRLGMTALAIVSASCADSRSAPLTAPQSAASSLVKVRPKPAIVLVHGAWSDGSAWQHVIPLLEQDGYRVIATQIALRSVDADVATAKRLIDAQEGPVVVVGHSYGGVVITGAAAGNSNVKALVYIAAFAPDAGEALGALNGRFPPTAISSSLTADAAGFLYIDREKFRRVFAPDVRPEEARTMEVTQTPLNSVAFTQSVPVAAWKTIPSWFLVSKEDQVIDPALERFMARRMGAHTSEIHSSHVSLISHPRAVAEVIKDAANAVGR